MTDKVKAKLRGWNARCLSRITGRDFRDEIVEPAFNLLNTCRTRARRLRWAGHILRSEESNLLHRVLLAQTEHEIRSGHSGAGGLLMDARFSSTDALLDLAGDRKCWDKAVRELLPEKEEKPRKRKLEESGVKWSLFNVA